MTYQIQWSNGRSEDHDTYDQAVAAVCAAYEDAAIGHSGDLSDGGDRTLCWEDEESSVDDDGACAVCSIIRIGDDDA